MAKKHRFFKHLNTPIFNDLKNLHGKGIISKSNNIQIMHKSNCNNAIISYFFTFNSHIILDHWPNQHKAWYNKASHCLTYQGKAVSIICQSITLAYSLQCPLPLHQLFWQSLCTNKWTHWQYLSNLSNFRVFGQKTKTSLALKQVQENYDYFSIVQPGDVGFSLNGAKLGQICVHMCVWFILSH